jgi:uncharacterized Ntn-hydrolase superfamily protein
MKNSLAAGVNLLVFILITSVSIKGQSTFSIVAVDPVTGQVGSAGASCIAGSIIISDVHPGVGVIHTQSFYLAQNQNYANYLMNQGYSPQEIIDSLVANDAQNNPAIRQYGIVDLIGGGRSAAYTGASCIDYKGHLLGPDYAIAGNILLGPQILDSMETKFLNTPGTLADKLMAALQGAKVIGADTRCTSRGTSSISAFIRVANPQDTTGQLHLHLNVNNTPVGVDPIDSLQILYNMWIPVELISFTASVNSEDVFLRWSTASELNNLGFEIQRSYDSEDFFTIGFVNGNGTTTELKNYSFTDKPGRNNIYYRLKQVDFDGSFEYSNIIYVDGITGKDYVLEQNFPNPFNPATQIKFKIPEAGKVKLEVYNLLGQKISVLVNEYFDAGYYSIDFDAGSISGGVYVYRISVNGYTTSKKMVLLR